MSETLISVARSREIAATKLRSKLAVAAADPTWPLTVSLGAPTGREYLSDTTLADQWVRAWLPYIDTPPDGIIVETKALKVTGHRTERVPTQLRLANSAAVAKWAGLDTVLAAAHARWTQLEARFPATAASLWPNLVPYTDLDFTMLCETATWWSTHDPTQYSLRQLPIPGMHTKWLTQARADTAALAGRTGHTTTLPRPAPAVHYHLHDPEHHGPRHLSWQPTDPAPTPPSWLSMVLIVENRDTAYYFPPPPGSSSSKARESPGQNGSPPYSSSGTPTSPSATGATRTPAATEPCTATAHGGPPSSQS